MWHTHNLSSLRLYDNDCKAIVGSTFHHDDSFNDRIEGGDLGRLLSGDQGTVAYSVP